MSVQDNQPGCGVTENRIFKNNSNPKPSTERGYRRAEKRGGTKAAETAAK